MKVESYKEAIAQEDEYLFPYHYVTSFKNGRFREHFIDTWGVNYALTLEFIIGTIGSAQPDSLIDIGCGDGRLIRELSLNTSISKLCGVDFSQRAITLAQAMNQDRYGISFRAVDILKPHDLGQFESAVLMEVFEHIPLDLCKEFMVAVRRLIKPGGKIYLTVPHANKNLEYKHFQHFSSKILLEYIQPYFHVDKIVPFEKIAFSRRFLNFFLCNRWFILNNTGMLNTIYRYHKRYLFKCSSETECQRIYLEATAQ